MRDTEAALPTEPLTPAAPLCWPVLIVLAGLVATAAWSVALLWLAGRSLSWMLGLGQTV